MFYIFLYIVIFLTVGINCLNLSHTEKEIDKYLEVSEMAMIDIKKAIEQDSTEGILNCGKISPIFRRNIVELD